MDPAGASYVVNYDEHGRAYRFTDELGLITSATHDGRGRLLTYTYPEGDIELFEYDERNNTTRLTKSPTTGSGLSDLVIEAAWHSDWNKPIWIRDAMGRQTDFTYYESGNGKSLLHTATRQAPDLSFPGVRPVYTFEYNNIGQVTKTTDPTGLVVLNSYQSGGNRNLLNTRIDPSGINIRTEYLHNAIGDVIQTKDPRGTVTEQTFDWNRRPRETLHHDGGVSAPLLSATRVNYDAEGRVVSEEAASAISGTDVTAWETLVTKTYTPTGQVATQTDGDNRTTLFDYDALDRLEITTDPLGRKTKSIYDPAGRVLKEIRGYGSRVQIDYATYTYTPSGNKASITDANGNTTTYTYDGFHRLVRTCFPGAGDCSGSPVSDRYEEYESYDANGNPLVWRNRANERLTYSYDRLDRRRTRTTSGVTTTWGYDLAGRVQTITDSAGYSISNGYDSAMRLTSTTRSVPGLSGTQKVEYVLDKNGNRTRLIWPDSYFV